MRRDGIQAAVLRPVARARACARVRRRATPRVAPTRGRARGSRGCSCGRPGAGAVGAVGPRRARDAVRPRRGHATRSARPATRSSRRSRAGTASGTSRSRTTATGRRPAPRRVLPAVSAARPRGRHGRRLAARRRHARLARLLRGRARRCCTGWPRSSSARRPRGRRCWRWRCSPARSSSRRSTARRCSSRCRSAASTPRAPAAGRGRGARGARRARRAAPGVLLVVPLALLWLARAGERRARATPRGSRSSRSASPRSRGPRARRRRRARALPRAGHLVPPLRRAVRRRVGRHDARALARRSHHLGDPARAGGRRAVRLPRARACRWWSATLRRLPLAYGAYVARGARAAAVLSGRPAAADVAAALPRRAVPAVHVARRVARRAAGRRAARRGRSRRRPPGSSPSAPCSRPGTGSREGGALLDALGTLVELERPVAAARRRAARRAASRSARTTRERRCSPRWPTTARTTTRRRDSPGSTTCAGRCAGIVRRELGTRAAGRRPSTDALLAALRFRPYPEVPGVLAALRERGRRARRRVSNWDVSLHDVARAHRAARRCSTAS